MNNGDFMVDIAHLAVIIGAFVAYIVLHLSGHADHSTDTGILTLAAFLGGSFVRSKDTRGSK